MESSNIDVIKLVMMRLELPERRALLLLSKRMYVLLRALPSKPLLQLHQWQRADDYYYLVELLREGKDDRGVKYLLSLHPEWLKREICLPLYTCSGAMLELLLDAGVDLRVQCSGCTSTAAEQIIMSGSFELNSVVLYYYDQRGLEVDGSLFSSDNLIKALWCRSASDWSSWSPLYSFELQICRDYAAIGCVDLTARRWKGIEVNHERLSYFTIRALLITLVVRISITLRQMPRIHQSNYSNYLRIASISIDDYDGTLSFLHKVMLAYGIEFCDQQRKVLKVHIAEWFPVECKLKSLPVSLPLSHTPAYGYIRCMQSLADEYQLGIEMARKLLEE